MTVAIYIAFIVSGIIAGIFGTLIWLAKSGDVAMLKPDEIVVKKSDWDTMAEAYAKIIKRFKPSDYEDDEA